MNKPLASELLGRPAAFAPYQDNQQLRIDPQAEARAHIYRALVKALDMLDEVIALIRASQTVDIARAGLCQRRRRRGDQPL